MNCLYLFIIMEQNIEIDDLRVSPKNRTCPYNPEICHFMRIYWDYGMMVDSFKHFLTFPPWKCDDEPPNEYDFFSGVETTNQIAKETSGFSQENIGILIQPGQIMLFF